MLPADTIVAAPLPGAENPYYVQAVAALARRQAMVAECDIYSSNGMMLAARGSVISEPQFERLAQHKLQQPLDSLVRTSHSLDAGDLALAAAKILEHDNVQARLAARSGDPLAVKQGLAALKLPAPLCLRLTVMRELRPAMFEHSLRSAMIAFALAQRLRLPAAERYALLIAALCHDIGEMHTDPELLDRRHDITPEERRFIHVHPLSGHLLLREMAGFPARSAQAVLQHHERLDGSGYPHGLRGDKIAPLARLVAVADVAESVIQRFDLPRLDMLTRLHQARFDHAAVDALRDLIHATPQDASGAPHGPAAAQLGRLDALLHAWRDWRGRFERQLAPDGAEHSALAFLFERMQSIRLLMLQAGVDPEHVAGMLDVARDDPGILLELRSMLDEMDWLLHDLGHEIDRRAAELKNLPAQCLSPLLQHLQPRGAMETPNGRAEI
ncbi:HD-GYP domain-containing protein [Rugamonas sp. CCM 8940]|uniref:HD-GYP domain-containing protein n=1 Tax=Rugamonas sp. CCM 8940 TaxID=2765359 RepID=UPI0018F4A7D6|nr:HD domain-containing phosphohydrolase [Rugamonas sp. CCM 8940]MBJ7312587.1 HD domain-containing protein [Rugamonas sp. CCM 8940]